MENLALDVVDSMTGDALPGATVSINGQPIGAANDNGVFYLQDVDESDRITVSHVGYGDYSITAGVLEGSGQVQMARAGDVLPTVTVSPSPKKSLLTPLLIGGGLFLLATDKQKKSVGAKNNTALYIGLGALGLGAVYLMSRPRTPAYNPYQYVNPYTGANNSGSSAASEAAGWASVAAGLFNSVKGLFGGGSAPTAPVDSQGGYSDYIISGVE